MFLKGNDFLKNVFTFQSSVTAQFTMFLFNIIHLHLIIMYFCSNINSNFAYFHVEGYFLFDYMMLWWGEFCKFCLETGKQRKTKFRFWNHVHFFFFLGWQWVCDCCSMMRNMYLDCPALTHVPSLLYLG